MKKNFNVVISFVILIISLMPVGAFLLKKELESLAISSVSLLTFMVAITSLLYTRVGVLTRGSLRNQSLQAVEHCLEGTLMFGVGIVVSAAFTITFVFFTSSGKVDDEPLSNWIYLNFSIFFLMNYFLYKFIYGLRLTLDTLTRD